MGKKDPINKKLNNRIEKDRRIIYNVKECKVKVQKKKNWYLREKFVH